jgi:hypothetical protein
MFSPRMVTNITSARGTVHCRKTRIPCGDQLMICGLYSFLTLALDGGEWSASCPVSVLPPGKGPQSPLDRRLGGPQSWSGHKD